ncbi:EamA family transporter RarD [Brachyspira pilosicoli]|uniref:EamA family transporter RarD n=1 Tax=Brachyspira pilosicoli TaxID=52584 RepID=A0AAJ6KDQ2_BRAPL|nr:EamA family transporter RarD [Brachyspira pilosicoli]WIH81150.1 EamA family transporter RarD [Brachyspira pilosicoli]WIH85588.1 EamA family transporter RarD [Brachyspira pilosicoli]WIH90131.1 EamA family transporter RarD [Brachyspira pilosicoli]WIH92422.1 EamA family transporter RarD [Brachyspira pilosicoli]WIH94714.1 EamA family transporter RarD [Brachyspira pilosicoli]
MSNNNNKSIFLAASAYIMWGLLPIYWKAVQNFDSAFVLGVRVITTFIFTLIIIIFKKANLYRGIKPLVLIFIAGIFLGLNWYLYIYTVNSGNVLEAGLAYYIAPILSILIGIIFFREKKTILEYLAIVLMFIGMIYQTITLGKPPIMAFFIGLTFSVYGILKKMTIYSGWESLFLETLSILIPSIIISKLYFPATPQPTNTWITLMFAGVATGIPLYLYAKAAKSLEVSTLGFLQFFVPLLATLLAIFVYKEELNFNRAITLAIIILAAILYAVSIFRKSKANKKL